MKATSFVVVGLLGAMSAAANAGLSGFTGWAANSYASANGNAIIDVYAMFGSTSDKLLNVFNMNITLTNATNFVQNDVAGGAWQPLPDFTPNTDDSFVTIGQAPGFANTTQLDPNFTNNFSTLPPVANAGWYNGNPTTFTAFAAAVTVNQGATAGGLGVWVGRFTVAGLTEAPRLLNFNGKAAFNDGSNLFDSRVFSYVPAPGALALLGLAGVAGRRRRA